MNRWARIGLVSAVASAVTIVGVTGYMIHSLARPKRLKIRDNPSNLDLKYEDVSFAATVDGVMLRGWYIKAKKRSKRCIIMTHSGGFHRADPTIPMLGIIKALAEHGFNVLTYDLRGHGESENGKAIGGHFERRDVLGAATYVEERGILPQHIGLFGFSVGAAASLLAAAENKRIQAVVSDSSWADLKELIRSKIAKRPYIPISLTPIVLLTAKLAHGVDFDEVKPLATVARIAPRPIFFIHGEFDRTVPVESALRLYHSSDNPNNRLWVVPGAPHVGSYKTRPEEYVTKVTAFFDQALK